MTTNTPSAVRFARRSTRGLLLGFSTPRVAVFAAAAAVGVVALFTGGLVGFVVTSVVWAPLMASGVFRIAGRPAIEWSATALHYGARKATGQLEFRARPTRPRPAGTLALPGDAASLRLHVDEVTGAAMIHDPHRQTLTAVLPVSHPAFALLDDTDRAGRVGRWGRVLASLAASGTCAAIQVLEATVPDPARGQREWWAEHAIHDGGWADTQYRTLLDQVSLDSSTHRSTISLSVDMRAAARAIRAAGRGLRGGAAVLRADMASLTDGLRAAGLRPGQWMPEAELAALVRHAFDPAVALDTRSDPAANLDRAGPMAVSESWDRLRHETGWSQVLWISEWPRISVPADFLHPIVFAPGVRRTLCLLARPLPTSAALRQIRRDKTEAVSDSAQKARIGQLADLSDSVEYEDLLARERSIISGHTDVAFTGFVTVTAPTSEALEAGCAAIIRAAGQAACEVRPLYGQQMQGFVAAALPLARTTL